jgi:hypothetical protein
MGHLAICVYELGRLDEARELSQAVRAATAPDDLANLVFIDAIDGCLLAHDGQIAEARAAGRQALARVDESDFYFMRALTRVHVAEIQSVAGDSVEAVRLASEAVAIADAKGDVTFASRLRHRFAELGIEVA